jgi:transporter family-2 protein
MLENLGAVLIGLLGGIAVGIQTPMSGTMGQRVGSISASLIIHVGGALVSLIILLMRGGENIGQWRSLPVYTLGAGVFGVILYLTINVSFPKVGATTAIVLIIVGQLITGLVIDQFGLLGVTARPIDLSRAVAVVLLFSGAFLIAR